MQQHLGIVPVLQVAGFDGNQGQGQNGAVAAGLASSVCRAVQSRNSS